MRVYLAAAAIWLATVGAVAGETAPGPAPDVRGLVSKGMVADLQAMMANEVVRISVAAQNEKLGALSEAEILRLDDQWKAEREQADKPLIAATLASPLSTYLIRSQARSLGLYVEIFVMDRNGLNVGQSSITSDFWQGDEAKFQKSFNVGAGAVFVDEAEWDGDNGIWRAQVSFTLEDAAGRPFGAATVELNLTEIERRRGLGA